MLSKKIPVLRNVLPWQRRHSAESDRRCIKNDPGIKNSLKEIIKRKLYNKIFFWNTVNYDYETNCAFKSLKNSFPKF
jgi:hypothetical protein